MTPQTDVALAPLCTMGVGGAARFFVDATSESDVCSALRWAREREMPVHVLGGGSNVVIADEGFDGLVLRAHVRAMEEVRAGGRVEYRVGAGEPWDPLVAHTVRANCAGLECLSGIPGFAGGTPIQNVGAYGQEVSQTIARVRVIDRTTGACAVFSNQECGFGYRTSRFKRESAGRFVVTGVEFVLVEDGAPTLSYADLLASFGSQSSPSLEAVRDATLAVRRRKGMVIEPGNAANRSCGSFFVNPVVDPADIERVRAVTARDVPHYVIDAQSIKIPAAWLIEHAGFPRGTRRGPVGISPFQAQAIVNHGAARASDVVALACDVKRAVWTAFGIAIMPEPVFVGFTDASDLEFLLTREAAGRGA